MERKNKIFLLCLLLVCGLFIFAPFLNYQVYLSQGDHGRDLYAAEAVWRGELPYKDFWWVYGPLMPYVYGIFYKLFGASMSSMLLGYIAVKLTAGIFIFLGLSRVIAPIGAAICTLWFWSLFPDFFYTYNHAGGIALMMAATCSLLYYLKDPQTRYLYLGLLSLFLLAFVKINIGLFSLVGFVALVTAINYYLRIPFVSLKRFYVFALALVPALIFFVYFLFLKDLSIYEIRQCMPYLAEDHPYNAPPIVALQNLLELTLSNIASSPTSIIVALLVLLATVQIMIRACDPKENSAQKREIGLVILICIVLFIVNFHEFLASGSVIYRYYWAKPFSLLLMFILFNFAIQNLPRWIHIALSLTLVAVLAMSNYTQHSMIKMVKQNPWQNLDLPRAKVYLSNQPEWLQTVRQATQHLEQTVPLDQTFLAMPYDPLYYFLTGKKSPSRQLIFFEHINIPAEQERSVIEEMEKNNVQYVLISNRSIVPGNGLGILGETYCPLLGKYIGDNYDIVQNFGTWQPPQGDGWAWDHSVRILKRVK